MRKIALFVLPLLILGCARLSTMTPGASAFKPYHLDIPQGNIITQDMVNQLKPGMSRAQVMAVVGSPLVTDPFHENRWDYVYRMVRDGKLTDSRRLTLYFANDALSKIDAQLPPGHQGEPDTSTSMNMK